jgi:hypothetical protein
MKFKDGVQLFGICPEISVAMLVVDTVYRELGNYDNCVCTSVRDGEHKRSSDHYKGDAFDMRVWGFQDITLNAEPVCDYTGQEVADIIQSRLTNEFEVFFEGDHIHIGFDPDTL